MFKELQQRLIRDENLALLVKRLELGEERKAGGIWCRCFAYAIPDLLKLLEKLPNLEKLM